uniref:Domain of unknown function DB domain-containing protein n=1 Tax=Romanomermis culicivorax TaxID=13658 RepID=A0A915IE42_ROMCU
MVQNKALDSFEKTLHFKACCRNKNLGPDCMKLCDFGLTRQEAERMTRNNRCLEQNLQAFFGCLSNGKNNIACCTDRKIFQEKRHRVCQPFCHPTGHNWSMNRTEAEKFRVCKSLSHEIAYCHMAYYF